MYEHKPLQYVPTWAFISCIRAVLQASSCSFSRHLISLSSSSSLISSSRLFRDSSWASRFFCIFSSSCCCLPASTFPRKIQKSCYSSIKYFLSNFTRSILQNKLTSYMSRSLAFLSLSHSASRFSQTCWASSLKKKEEIHRYSMYLLNQRHSYLTVVSPCRSQSSQNLAFSPV